MWDEQSPKGEKMGFILEERDKKAGQARIIGSPRYTWLHTQNHPEKHTKSSMQSLTVFTAQLWIMVGNQLLISFKV